jgi:hypothetical protein
VGDVLEAVATAVTVVWMPFTGRRGWAVQGMKTASKRNHEPNTQAAYGLNPSLCNKRWALKAVVQKQGGLI